MLTLRSHTYYKRRTFWIKEWKSASQLDDELKAWVVRYNTDFPHSSLSYKTLEQFEKEQLSCTTKNAA
jgi:transposase InsO family protein